MTLNGEELCAQSEVFFEHNAWDIPFFEVDEWLVCDVYQLDFLVSWLHIIRYLHIWLMINVLTVGLDQYQQAPWILKTDNVEASNTINADFWSAIDA